MNTNPFNFLVVEDNASMLRMIVSMLRTLGVKNCLTAMDGQIAWSIIQEKEISIVLSDYFMPRMDGLELLAKIRSSERHWELPFVMITSEARKRKVIYSTEENIDAYIIKPVTTEKLGKYVGEVLVNRYEPDAYHQALSAGQRYLRGAKINEAKTCFDEAVNLEPHCSTPYYYLGEIYEGLGELKEAEYNYLKCNDTSNNLFVKSYDGLARIYLQQGDYANAAESLKKAVRVSPDNLKRSLELGRVYTKIGHMTAAAESFQQAANVAGGDVSLTEQIATECFNCGLEEGAEKILRGAYSKEHGEIKVLNQFGIMCRERKEYDRARDYYQQALKIDPRNDFVNYNCAILHIELKEYQTAKSYLERALKHHPDFKEGEALLEKLTSHL